MHLLSTLSHVFIILQRLPADQALLHKLALDYNIQEPFKEITPKILYSQSFMSASAEMDNVRQIEDQHKINIWFLPKQMGKGKWLLLCDLDSTLIQMEVIDELAKITGLEDQIKVHNYWRIEWCCYG